MAEAGNYETIKVEYKDKVAWVTLNRPQVRNAFNAAMIAEMTAAFEAISADRSLRVVVLTGQGTSFCAGADLNWMGDVINYSYEQNLEDSLNLAKMFRRMSNCPLPTIARVNGPAIGGGTGMVAVCDLVVASEKAVFSLSEVKIGLVPACISPYVIRRLGDKNSREFFLTGERLTAQKAYAAGLINFLVDESELDNKVNELIEKLICSGPEALSWCKKLLAKVPGMNEKEAGVFTAEVITKLRMSDEGQEGMKAFFEKRKPNWCKK